MYIMVNKGIIMKAYLKQLLDWDDFYNFGSYTGLEAVWIPQKYINEVPNKQATGVSYI